MAEFFLSPVFAYNSVKRICRTVSLVVPLSGGRIVEAYRGWTPGFLGVPALGIVMVVSTPIEVGLSSVADLWQQGDETSEPIAGEGIEVDFDLCRQ
jgi:hypothetical protein